MGNYLRARGSGMLKRGKGGPFLHHGDIRSPIRGGIQLLRGGGVGDSREPDAQFEGKPLGGEANLSGKGKNLRRAHSVRRRKR